MGCIPSITESQDISTPHGGLSSGTEHTASTSQSASQEDIPNSADTDGPSNAHNAVDATLQPLSRADQLKAYFQACNDLVRIDEPYTRLKTQEAYVNEHCPLPSRASRVWSYYDDKKQAHRRHHRAVLADLREEVNPDETARTEAFKRASDLHTSLGFDGEMSVGIARSMVCHLTAFDAEAMSFQQGASAVEPNETADNRSTSSTADERRNTIDRGALPSVRWPWAPQFGPPRSLRPRRTATEQGCDEGAIDVESGCWKCSWVRDARNTIESADSEWRVSTFMETTPYEPSPAVPSDDRRQHDLSDAVLLSLFNNNLMMTRRR